MRDSRLDIPASAEAAANLLKKENPVLDQLQLVSPVVIPDSYPLADSACTITIHPWEDGDMIQLTLWNAVMLHSWLLTAVQVDYSLKPLELGSIKFWKDGYTARISGFPRAMSHDTMIRVTKAIGEQVQQIKQTASSLINF